MLIQRLEPITNFNDHLWQQNFSKYDIIFRNNVLNTKVALYYNPRVYLFSMGHWHIQLLPVSYQLLQFSVRLNIWWWRLHGSIYSWLIKKRLKTCTKYLQCIKMIKNVISACWMRHPSDDVTIFFSPFQRFEYQTLVEHDEKPPQPKFGVNWFIGAWNMAKWKPD